MAGDNYFRAKAYHRAADTLSALAEPLDRVIAENRLRELPGIERLVRAASNPYVTVIGHITGRQLLRRPGYDLDIERVLGACAEHGVAVEVNGNPWRLDLDWRWLRRGIEIGCIFSINPDAHATGEIASSTRWGVAIARKSGMPADRVINTLDGEEFGRWLENQKRGSCDRPRSAPETACHRWPKPPRPRWCSSALW